MKGKAKLGQKYMECLTGREHCRAARTPGFRDGAKWIESDRSDRGVWFLVTCLRIPFWQARLVASPDCETIS